MFSVFRVWSHEIKIENFFGYKMKIVACYVTRGNDQLFAMAFYNEDFKFLINFNQVFFTVIWQNYVGFCFYDLLGLWLHIQQSLIIIIAVNFILGISYWTI